MYLPIYLSICLSSYLSIYLSISLSVYLSVYLQAWKEAILRDVLGFLTWQSQKRSNPARVPQLLNLIASKTKQFCETSSFFEVDNIKNERILRDFLQKWKVQCRADGLVPMRFAIFPIRLSKVLCLPRKSDAGSHEVLHLSRKIISANLKIWCSKMQPFSGNQRPDLLTALMNIDEHVSCTAPATEHASWQILFKCPTPAIVFGNATKPSRFAHFWQGAQSLLFLPCETTSERPKAVRTPGVLTFWLRYVLHATTACTFSTSELPKVVRTWCVLYILTWKCASRHNGVHFFDISTSKSAPNVRWF